MIPGPFWAHLGFFFMRELYRYVHGINRTIIVVRRQTTHCQAHLFGCGMVPMVAAAIQYSLDGSGVDDMIHSRKFQQSAEQMCKLFLSMMKFGDSCCSDAKEHIVKLSIMTTEQLGLYETYAASKDKHSEIREGITNLES